jgi:hypothetical protein
VNRNAPLQRRTPLQARTGLRTTTRLAAYKTIRQVSKKRAAENNKRRAMLQAKYPGRPMCEVPWCNKWADDAHEPLTRARGGSITDPGNVKVICRPHHDEITFTEPAWAYELGFLVHSWGGEAA